MNSILYIHTVLFIAGVLSSLALDAAVASQQDMDRARVEAQEYLRQGKTYLGCGLMNRRQHNQLLGQLEIFSARYNDELVEYRHRSQVVAEIDESGANRNSGAAAK